MGIEKNKNTLLQCASIQAQFIKYVEVRVYGLVLFFIYLCLQNVHGLPLSAVFGIPTATLNEKTRNGRTKDVAGVSSCSIVMIGRSPTARLFNLDKRPHCLCGFFFLFK